MIVYHYDKETGFLLGQSEAIKDPEEAKFLLPADSTFNLLPKYEEGKELPWWNGKAWEVKEDPKLTQEKEEAIEQAAIEQKYAEQKAELEIKEKQEADSKKAKLDAIVVTAGTDAAKAVKDLVVLLKQEI